MSQVYAASEPAFNSATIAASSCERAPIALARSPKVVAPAMTASPDYRIFHPTAPLKICCLAKSGKVRAEPRLSHNIDSGRVHGVPDVSDLFSADVKVRRDGKRLVRSERDQE